MKVRNDIGVEPGAEAAAVAAREPARSAPRGGPAGPVGGGFGLEAGWWPVGYSADVVVKPRAVRLGRRHVVIYRDGSGTPMAVLDRCPHRRLPLSMGRLTDQGLQCGYHGWTFDGVSGQCTLIPNFRPGETPSRRIKVAVYEVAEAQGYVFLWTGPGAPVPAAPPVLSPGHGARALMGAAEVRSPHAEVADALLFNPGAALGLGWLFGGGYELTGPEVSEEGGTVTVRRTRLTLNLPRIGTFDPFVERPTSAVITTHAATGLTGVTADLPLGRGTASALIGLTPVGEHRTIVRWCLRAQGAGAWAVLSAVRAAATGRRMTGRVVGSLEGAADATQTVADSAIDLLRGLRDAPPAGDDQDSPENALEGADDDD